MITHIKGRIIDKEERSLVVDVNGLGYKAFVTGATLEKARDGAEIALWTHLAVREDAHTLFGFPSKDELNFFELLISVSGIGPKTALGILNVSSVANIRKAVSTGDTSHLTKVSGVGKKIADKIVLELKGKFDAEDSAGISLRDEVDALEALKALGFKHSDAREALKQVDRSVTDTGERVKKALKVLGK
ncbi:MAG TPA: Holliday junction branch migration protein RuvA [Candidatus Paceibacterota bacterium]|nr:Holliday junction branch migration protein RuvA [Candidatus Paceibacterota bacterium]